MHVRLGAIMIGLGLVFAGLWLMWPSPINAVYWDEPEAPALTGALAPTPTLADAHFTQLGEAGAARCFVIAPDGAIYYGTADGEVRRHDPSQTDALSLHSDPVIADFGELPVIGLDWINASSLGVTTPGGLFAVNLESGAAHRISAGVPGYPFGYANDLAVTADGAIYFTDSSTLMGRGEIGRGYRLDMLENRPHGALYVWEPDTHQTRLAADRLYYPNGVAIASDQQSVFIAETFRYRIIRHWIAGPRAGETEVFADNLPGLPDGLESDGAGHLLIAMPARRNTGLRTVRQNPWLAQILARLPDWMQPKAGIPDPFIAVLDETSGALLGTLNDPQGRICQVSNLTVAADRALWFGSTDCGYLAQIPQAAVLADLRRPEAATADSGR